MIDETILARLRASMSDDGTIVRQLIDMYAKDSPKQLANAAAALERNEMDALARAAHSLKSTSASMGATVVSGLALELEGHARQNDAVRAAEALERLRTAVSDTVAVFAKMAF